MAKNNEFTKKQKDRIIKEQFKGKKVILDPVKRQITKENVEVDHIIPKSKGGKSNLNNAQLLHPKTNQEKSDNLSGIIGPKSNKVKFTVKNNPTNPKMTLQKVKKK